MPPQPRPTVSLAPAAEIEADEQHLGGPAVRQPPERLEASRLLDRALRFEVEREVPGALDELQIGHGPVAVHEEGHLRLKGRALERSLPAAQHLRHDVLQVLGERELHALRAHRGDVRSEEHTSELQSLAYLVCRLLLEKKNKKDSNIVVRHND